MSFVVEKEARMQKDLKFSLTEIAPNSRVNRSVQPDLVTVDYLNNANEIEIKIAQGAKPGEGGQITWF